MRSFCPDPFLISSVEGSGYETTSAHAIVDFSSAVHNLCIKVEVVCM